MPELSFDDLAETLRSFQSGTPRPILEVSEPYTVEAYVRAFTANRDELFALLDTIDDVQITFKPSPNDFSISEVISHMITAQGGVYNALLDLSHIVMPLIQHVQDGPGAGARNNLTVAGARATLQEATDEMTYLMREVARVEVPVRREYPFFGVMTTKSWMYFMMAHERDHALQALAVAKSEGFPQRREVHP
jgi:hypothetical protein